MREKVVSLIKFVKSVPARLRVLVHTLGNYGFFYIILLLFFVEKLFSILFFLKKKNVFQQKVRDLSERIEKVWQRIYDPQKQKVSRYYLVSLAYKSLMQRKSRTLVTILGMSFGIGIIVFLLSLGYGIERLVISRVATLDELRMIDVTPGGNSAVRLSKDVVKKILKYEEIKEAIPVISAVGRVVYNKATTDVVAYAVPDKYFKYSRVKLVKGKFFEDKSSLMAIGRRRAKSSEEEGVILGLFAKHKEGKYMKEISDEVVKFNFVPEKRIKVWEECSVESKLLGFTRRIEGGFKGKELWGGDFYPFSPNGRVGYDKEKKMFLGRWLWAKFPLYQEDAKGNLRLMLDDYGRPLWSLGCVPLKDVEITDRFKIAEVLGESTKVATGEVLLVKAEEESTTEAELASTQVVKKTEDGLELVVLEATGSGTTRKEFEEIEFAKEKGEVVVSRRFLTLFNIPVSQAIGKSFEVSFILSKNIIPDIDGKAITSQVPYRIVGVIDDDTAAYFYLPFSDFSMLPVKNFTQLRLVLENKKQVAKVRKEVETLGLKTSSVLDTVKQIENLFANLRVVLGLIGFVALGVASLGMFNTLTVSLLERTREVGGMKVMGVVSSEIYELFLSEAMIMGVAGGLGGLLFGFLGGKSVSLLVSSLSLVRGQGYLELSYIPLNFVIFILVSSFIIGIITGWYPARRARKISALDALRYE